jgi:hypothetical protein
MQADNRIPNDEILLALTPDEQVDGLIIDYANYLLIGLVILCA